VRREVPSRSYQRSPTISSSIFFVEMEEGEKSLSLYRWSHCHFLPPFLLVKGRRTPVTVWWRDGQKTGRACGWLSIPPLFPHLQHFSHLFYSSAVGRGKALIAAAAAQALPSFSTERRYGWVRA
jgi:hypothetical protein